MTKWKPIGYAALACVLGAMPACVRGEDQSVEWLGSYREGLRQAQQTHKPLFVEFRCEA
jgi:hypothetical protein